MTYRYTYIVECRSRGGAISYYVGGTNDPRQRIQAHLAGRGARYLRGREILRVIYTSEHVNDFYAETMVKRWPREKKAVFVEQTFKHGEFHHGRFEDIEKIVLLDGTKLIDKHFDLLWFSCPCQWATVMRNIRGKLEVFVQ